MLLDKVVGVVGLGYVGLPLAIEFGSRIQTVAYDINESKVRDLQNHIDLTHQIDADKFAEAVKLSFTSNLVDLSNCDFLIVAVPTPVNDDCLPDLTILESVTKSVAKVMKTGTTVIFESTVYPSVTEDICVGILEAESGLTWKSDFFVGYSPERINPGDKSHGLTQVVKVVSGDTPETLEVLSELYSLIITAGVFKATSIRVAETAKVIENTQRDLNIALMNEISKILNRLDISTDDVLKTAQTKWNFLPFRPGLVGGHCIGVDPYYLTYKAESIGYKPEIILAGRRMNDGMAAYVADEISKLVHGHGLTEHGLGISVLGISFKENCPDFRNSKTFDLMADLVRRGYSVSAHDPFLDNLDTPIPDGVQLYSWEELKPSQVVVCPVPHTFYKEMEPLVFSSKLVKDGLFFDLKSAFDNFHVMNASVVWSL